MKATAHLSTIAVGAAPTLREPTGDLSVTTLDTQGRLALLSPARCLGWHADQQLALSVHDGVLRLWADSAAFHRRAGVTLVLDDRLRVQLPYGIRVAHDLRSGSRLLIVSAPTEGAVAALPVWRVVAAFGART